MEHENIEKSLELKAQLFCYINFRTLKEFETIHIQHVPYSMNSSRSEMNPYQNNDLTGSGIQVSATKSSAKENKASYLEPNGVDNFREQEERKNPQRREGHRENLIQVK